MARLKIQSGALAGKEIEIPLGERRVLGRSKKADISIPDAKLSRLHCVIESGLTGFYLTDLDSANGTWYNGQRIEEIGLQNDMRLRIGETEVAFTDEADYNAPETQVSISTKRSKMRQAREAMRGQQEGFISAKSYFCETCGRHIPKENRDSGDAKEIEGYWLCLICVPRYTRLKKMGEVSNLQDFTAWLRHRELRGEKLKRAQAEAEAPTEPAEGQRAEDTRAPSLSPVPRDLEDATKTPPPNGP
jgi:pSer/pThr/pTyr-binding forkhead associated (FHA) protein